MQAAVARRIVRWSNVAAVFAEHFDHPEARLRKLIYLGCAVDVVEDALPVMRHVVVKRVGLFLDPKVFHAAVIAARSHEMKQFRQRTVGSLPAHQFWRLAGEARAPVMGGQHKGRARLAQLRDAGERLQTILRRQRIQHAPRCENEIEPLVRELSQFAHVEFQHAGGRIGLARHGDHLRGKVDAGIMAGKREQELCRAAGADPDVEHAPVHEGVAMAQQDDRLDGAQRLHAVPVC